MFGAKKLFNKILQGKQVVLFMDNLVGLGVGTCTFLFTNIDLRLCLAPFMITTINCSYPLIHKDTPNTTVLSVKDLSLRATLSNKECSH